uniref:Uncharacterized protein n=1 Tax=Myotis lucifugus TaxID=59463 RepID=G1PYQ4_MYOLU
MSHSCVLELREVMSEAIKPDVVVSEQHCVVDLSLPEPGLFIPRGEYLDRHTLTMPQASPHLAIAALS